MDKTCMPINTSIFAPAFKAYYQMLVMLRVTSEVVGLRKQMHY